MLPLSESGCGGAGQGSDGALAAGVRIFKEADRAWDAAGFGRAAAAFAAVEDSARARTWEGAAHFHRLLTEGGGGSAAVLEAARAALARGLREDSGNGEAHALMGAIYGMTITANPGKGLWLGPGVLSHNRAAAARGAENPRVWYLLGTSAYHGPAVLGGMGAALEHLLKAEKLFKMEARRPAAPLEARWGRAGCLLFIGKTYEALGRRAEAEAYFRKAADENPRCRLVEGPRRGG